MKTLSTCFPRVSHWAPALCISAALSSTAFAATTVETRDVFGLRGQEVPDELLASMRGRFVEGRNVAFFGIQMRTDWLQADTRRLDMQMNIGIDLSAGRHQPVINIFHTQNLGNTVANETSPALNGVSDNGALESVSGVVQNIQVAGDGNSIHNNVGWVVREQSGTGAPAANGLTSTVNGGHYVDTSGRHTQVLVGNQGLGYQIDIPGIGRVTQQLSGQNLKGGALLQSSQLSSNYNQIFNNIGLQVDLTPARQDMSRLRTLQNSLDQLRGL